MKRRATRAAAQVLLVAGMTCAAPGHTADRAPDWLLALAREPVDSVAARFDAVVLLNERHVEVMRNGRCGLFSRSAVRVIHPAGRARASGMDYYQANGPKGEQRGWLIRPSGSVTLYKESAVTDIAINKAINESARSRIVSAGHDAGPGSVFGFESKRDERSVFLHFIWLFDGDRPVRTSRFVLKVPAGWKVNARTTGPARIEPRVEGDSWIWEQTGLPALEEEPLAVARGCRATRLEVSVIPPADARPDDLVTPSDWADVSRWVAGLASPPSTLTPELKDAAERAVRGARTALDSVRAIAVLAQNIRYEALELGIERGGGYQPRPASEVLAGSYGDCKDKANLMKVLLSAVGQSSFLALVQVAAPCVIDPDWPAVGQFDHCIIAVQSRRFPECAARVIDPKWGHLLFFDPTDPTTSFGDLPSSEQGQLALLVDERGAGLVRMPESGPEHSSELRNVHLSIAEDGRVQGVLASRLTGQSAARERQRVRQTGTAERRKDLGRWLAESSGGIVLTHAEEQDAGAEGYRYSLDFDAPGYGQRVGDAMVIVRPIVAGRLSEPAAVPSGRRSEVQLRPSTFRETVVVVPPAGWKADELPPGQQIERPFGIYSLSCRATSEGVVCTRRLEIRSRTLPAAQYAHVRSFYAEARRAEETPIVFVRP